MRELCAAAALVLLAGCLVEEPSGDGDDALITDEGRTVRGSRDGIEVVVEWSRCGAGYCAKATATNAGDKTVQISSICESPWFDRMGRNGRDVAHREPMATCAAYGREPFAPGDVARTNLTWDGRVWVDERYETAPAGEYDWRISFWWDDAQGGQRQEATASVLLVRHG